MPFRHIVLLGLLSLPLISGGFAFLIIKNSTYNSNIFKAEVATIIPRNDPIPLALAPHAEYRTFDILQPVDGFKTRITKKPFGIFITPETSPVRPDKFTGYHNAVDIEYEDSNDEISVYAIADGTIVLSKYAYGYGGVIVIRHRINNQDMLALYGHLDPKHMTARGEKVTKGQKIALLGDGYTHETDGARKHLHFSITPYNEGSPIDIRGYVPTQEELSKWIDPLSLFN